MVSQRRAHNDRRPAMLVVALSGLAWVLLWVWERAPAGRYLTHHSLDTVRGAPQLIPSLSPAGR